MKFNFKILLSLSIMLGTIVFMLFAVSAATLKEDDFTDNSLNTSYWTQTGSNCGESSQTLACSGGSGWGVDGIRGLGYSHSSYDNITMEWSSRVDRDNTNQAFIGWGDAAGIALTDAEYSMYHDGVNNVVAYADGTTALLSTHSNLTTETWYNFKIVADGDNAWYYYKANSSSNWYYWTTSTFNGDATIYPLYLHKRGDTEIDDFIIYSNGEKTAASTPSGDISTNLTSGSYFNTSSFSVQVNSSQPADLFYTYDANYGNDNEYALYEGNNDLVDNGEQFNSNNLTLTTGSTTYTTGKFGNALNFTNNNNYDTGILTTSIDTANAFTIDTWFKRPSYTTADDYLFSSDDSGSNRFYMFLDGDNVRVGISDWYELFPYTITDDTYYHITFTTDGTDAQMYINGVLQGTKEPITVDLPSKTIMLGSKGDSNANYLNGALDNFRIWNKHMNSSQVTSLYTYNLTTLFTDCTQDNVTLTQSEGKHFVTWVAREQVTVSTLQENFRIDTTIPSLNITNNSVSESYNVDFSQIVNGSDTCTVTTNGETFSCSNSSYDYNTNGNHSFNVTSIDLALNTNSSYNNKVLVNPRQFLYFNAANGSPLSTFYIDGVEYNNNYNFTLFTLGYGNHNLTFTRLGFQEQVISFTLNSTSLLNQTYSVSTARIQVYLRDQVTGDLLNSTALNISNFTVDFIATVGLSTTTDQGLINISNILFQDELYLVTVSHEDYNTEAVYFNFNNQEILTVTVYLTESNLTNLGNVFIKPVIGSAPIGAGVIVKALQWDSSLSRYTAVSQAQTGSEGVASLNIILDDKVYVFTATYNGVTGNSTSEIIETAENGKTISIPLEGLTQRYDYTLEDLYTRVSETFNNVTNYSTINFFWNDNNGIAQTGCISAYTIIGNSKSLETRNCTSGVSDIRILNFFINNSYRIQIVAEIKVGEGYIPIDTFDYQPSSNPGEVLTNLGLAAFVVPLLVLIGIGIGLFSENIYIGTLALSIFMGFSLYLAPGILSKSIVMFLFFIGWLTVNYGVKTR